ncbi:hypothetical protein LZ32DRAFT_193397 [Colletotrichum eremochloae]|nr:hypothetical protein LZ32DRAFT_193397 [Colletotrichum eremochloae]
MRVSRLQSALWLAIDCRTCFLGDKIGAKNTSKLRRCRWPLTILTTRNAPRYGGWEITRGWEGTKQLSRTQIWASIGKFSVVELIRVGWNIALFRLRAATKAPRYLDTLGSRVTWDSAN